MRGSRDFDDLGAYRAFIDEIVSRHNANHDKRINRQTQSSMPTTRGAGGGSTPAAQIIRSSAWRQAGGAQLQDFGVEFTALVTMGSMRLSRLATAEANQSLCRLRTRHMSLSWLCALVFSDVMSLFKVLSGALAGGIIGKPV